MSEPITIEELDRVDNCFQQTSSSDPPSQTAVRLSAACRQLLARVQELERERDLAIAHDRQPYPTADAYERVCKARSKWQERAEAADSTGKGGP